VGAGVAASTGEVTGAAAIIKVGGELQFAASIHGACVARQIDKALVLPLEVADAVLQDIANIGAGRPMAIYELTDKLTTVRMKFPAATPEVRFNAIGGVSATDQFRTSCLAPLGPCTLAPGGGYHGGQVVFVNIEIGVPNSTGPRRVLVSVAWN
jgi:hypothetical protein